MTELTVVLPAYNEGEGICETILEIDFYLPDELNTTIFVSEDGSRDNTREEVLRAASLVTKSNVVLSNHSSRLGYSKAVQRGIQECRTELICFMDADGQCDPKDIKKLLNQITNKTGIAIGFRNPRVDGTHRIAYSKLFGMAYRFFGGPKRIDPSSPFILGKIEQIRFLGSVECHLDFGFWWEFQWRIQAQGLNFIEMPVNHRVRTTGTTQVYTLKRLPNIIKSHLKGLRNLRHELKKK